MNLLRKLPRFGVLFSRGYSKLEITIPQGKLRGVVSTDIDGKEFYKFQGIPYAKPPIGELRFKAPVALKEWRGILDADKEGDACYGLHLLKKDTYIGSENCLFLNVYTKHVGVPKLKPVMFWIHGGAFVSGSANSDIYGPEFLITEDVVLVTVNYRLGIYGFLNMEDPSLGVPGNAGLKDVVMALEWVKNNIEHFGGDPNNVTVFGQSAGGVTTHLLTLSPTSRNLFHKTIAQSGSFYNIWTRGVKGLGQISPESNEKDVYKSLMRMSVEDLYKIQKKVDIFQSHVPSLNRPFGYVVEDPNDHAFLTEDPIDMVSRGDFKQVPSILGHVTAECSVFCSMRKRFYPGLETCEDMIPFTLGLEIGSEASQAMAKKLRNFYLGSDKLVKHPTERITMESDMAFVYGMLEIIMDQLPKSKTPIYFYRMSAETDLNLIKKFVKLKHPGTYHSDDIGYLFKTFATPKLIPGSKEEKTMRRFVRMWANFAKYGSPVPSKDDPLLQINWQPVTQEELHYLDIGTELETSVNPEEWIRAKFLRSLFGNGKGGK